MLFNPRGSNTAISLPLSIFKVGTTAIVFFVFNSDDSLFPFGSTEPNTIIGTPVIGATVPADISTDNLAENVTIMFKLQNSVKILTMHTES